MKTNKDSLKAQSGKMPMIVPYFLSTFAAIGALTVAGYMEVWFLGIGDNATRNLAAFGSVSAIQAWIIAVAYFFAMGTGCVVAGGRDKNVIRRSHIGIMAGAVAGIILGICSFLVPERWYMFLGAGEANVGQVAWAIKLLGISATPLIVSHIFGTTFRGMGKKGISAGGLFFMALVQVIVEYLLIRTGMEPFTAVIWGMVVSHFATVVVFLGIWIWMVMKDGRTLRTRGGDESILVILGEILRSGIPSLARQGSVSVGLWATNVTAGIYGMGVQSLMASASRFMTLPYSVVIALCQAYQPIASGNMERGEANKEDYYVTRRFGTWIVCLVAAGILLWGKGVLNLIPGDFAGKEAVLVVIGSQLFVYPFLMYTQLAITHFQVCKEWKAGTLLAVLRNGLLYVPLLWMLCSLLGIWGVLITQGVVDLLAYPIGHMMLKWKGHFAEKKVKL